MQICVSCWQICHIQRFIFLIDWYQTQYEPLQLSRYSEGPKSIDLNRFSMLHQFYAMQSCQILKLLHIIFMFRGVISRGTCFHSGTQWCIWQAQTVSWYCELSSGASGCILCVLALANRQYLHPSRVLLKGVANVWTFRNPSCLVHLTRNPSIAVHLTTFSIAPPDCCPQYRYEP